MSGLDPRTTPYRAGIAAESLRRVLSAESYVSGHLRVVRSGLTALHRSPTPASSLDTQLLRGEEFTVYAEEDDWVWGQSEADSYVGYVSRNAIAEPDASPTHRVNVPVTMYHAEPAAFAETTGISWFGGMLRVVSEAPVNGFVEVAEDGWLYEGHLADIESVELDPVEVAMRFVNAPYLLGGRTAGGIDCSALVQISFAAAGAKPPRDSDMQQESMGRPLRESEQPRRGDLVFWQGHVGILCDNKTLIHANAHHMAVAVEPLEEAIHRLDGKGLPVIAWRRVML